MVPCLAPLPNFSPWPKFWIQLILKICAVTGRLWCAEDLAWISA